MNSLQELVEGFKPETHSRVPRDDRAYQETWDYISSELERKVQLAQEQFAPNQTASLIREDIINLIRTYQDYCIKRRFSCHYRRHGLADTNCVFEHVIPLARIRDMLVQNRLTVNQALNAPTCLISKQDNDLLSKNGLSASSPNNFYFFRRYAVLNSTFDTFSGMEIKNINQWSLKDHYVFFGIQ